MDQTGIDVPENLQAKAVTLPRLRVIRYLRYKVAPAVWSTARLY